MVVVDAPMPPFGARRFCAQLHRFFRRRRHAQLTRTPLNCLVRCNLHEQVAAATFVARERIVVGGLDVSGSCNHIAPGSSHWWRSYPLRSLPCRASTSSRRIRLAPIESENLGLRDEGWRLVLLKSLDSRCSGLGLVVAGNAGSQYSFWPLDRIRCTSAFWFLSR